MKHSRFPAMITFLVMAFLYLPILILAISSFNESRFGGVWSGFTFKWYERLLEESSLWLALRNSFWIGFTSTIAATVLGITAALSLHWYRSKFQRIHYGLIYAPLIIPDILLGVSLLFFFVALNLQLGLFTVFLAHTTFCVSYVTMVILSRLQTFDFAIIEAAQDLGANWIKVMYKIALPLMAPAIIAGALLSFTLSIDDFVITFFVSGPGATTLPVYVYSMIKFGSTPIVNALSVILLIATFSIVWMTQRLLNRS